MFKRIHRMSSWLFTPLMKSRSYFSSHFRVKSYGVDDEIKISVVIPKKLIKVRVQRNKIKRKILHYLRANVDINSKKHTVFWLTKDICNTEDIHWNNEINNLLDKIGIKKQY